MPIDGLWCLGCRSPLERGDSSSRCIGCGRLTPFVDDLYLDFLPDTDPDLVAAAELDYDAGPTLSGATPWARASWALDVRRRAAIVKEEVDGSVNALWIGGGGRNRLAALLANSIDTSVIVDPSAAQLAVVPKAGEVQVLVRALAEQLPIPDAWADFVDLPGVLDHVVSPERAVREALRCAKPGGLMMAALLNDGSWNRRLGRALGRPGLDDHHRRQLSAVDLVGLFRGAGVVDAKATTVGFARVPRVIDVASGKLLRDRAVERLSASADVLGRRLLGDTSGGITIVWGRAPGHAHTHPAHGQG